MPRTNKRRTTGRRKTVRRNSGEEYATAYPTVYVGEGKSYKKVDVKTYLNNNKDMIGLMNKMQKEVNKDPLVKQGYPLRITYESGLGMILDGVPKRKGIKALMFQCMNKHWKVTWK